MKSILVFIGLTLSFLSTAQEPLTKTAPVGNITDSVTTVQKILTNPYLTVFENQKLNSYFTVISFHLTALDPYGEYVMIDSRANTNYFTKEQLHIIKLLKPGSKLLFTSIRGSCPDCRIYSVPDFSLEIK